MRTQRRIRLTQAFAAFVLVIASVTESAWERRCESVSTLLFLAGCLLVGIASMGRLWCSAYIAGRKTKELITLGPYSLCRNPLYCASLLGCVGVGLASETLSIPCILALGFAVTYPGVIRREEAKLTAVHGADYEHYVRSTPRFVPRFRLLAEPAEYRLDPRRFREDLFRALWFVWLVGVLETFEACRELGLLPTLLRLY